MYQRNGKKGSAKRFTYAAVSDTASSVKRRVLCFAEDVKQSATSGPEKSSYDLPPSVGEVVTIDLISTSNTEGIDEDSQDVIIVHETGEIESFSADLKAQRWSANLGSILPSNDSRSSERMVQVEYALLTDAESARKGILKSREDVLASLDPAGDMNSDTVKATQLLCLVSRSTEQAVPREQAESLHVLAIRPRSKDVVTSRRSPLHYLLEWRLPTTSSESYKATARPEYSMHPPSGTLYRLCGGSIITYDLFGTVPRISSELSLAGSAFQSLTRLSSSTIMAASSDLCGIFNVKFNSVQALLPLNSDIEHASEDKKQEQSSSQLQHSSLRLLSYFPELSLSVGLAANQLVGLQLNSSHARPKRSKTGDGLLINSIGKGVGAKRSSTKKSNSTKRIKFSYDVFSSATASSNTEWFQQVSKLEESVAQNNVEEFERLFFTALNSRDHGYLGESSSSHSQTVAPFRNGQINGTAEPAMSNGVSENKLTDNVQLELRKESLENQPSEHFPDVDKDTVRQSQRPKALYALSKIFAWTLSVSGITASGKGATDQPPIFIQFFPPNVVRWLISMGYLTTYSIGVALRQHSLSKDRLKDLTAGSLVSAVVNFDPDMRLLYNLMNQSSYLEISEIVQAVKILVQSLDNIPLPQISQHLLTNDSATVPNGDLDSHIDSEADAASQDLSYALSTLEHGLSIRSQTLRQALAKLHSFPLRRITHTLRTTLTQHELIFLIQILRIELADGGWTSRYIDAGPAHLEALVGDPSDRAITIIASLLSCTLDAIGTGGWLVAGATNPADGADDLLLSLRAEISVALEGTHEASFMKGLLNDFLRFGAAKRRRQGLSKGDRRGRKKPVTVQLQAEDERVLPLGFKVEGRIEGTKVGAGGEVKEKSKREIGMEISKRVGKYSLERIRI